MLLLDTSLGLMTANETIVGKEFWGGDQRIVEQLAPHRDVYRSRGAAFCFRVHVLGAALCCRVCVP